MESLVVHEQSQDQSQLNIVGPEVKYQAGDPEQNFVSSYKQERDWRRNGANRPSDSNLAPAAAFAPTRGMISFGNNTIAHAQSNPDDYAYYQSNTSQKQRASALGARNLQVKLRIDQKTNSLRELYGAEANLGQREPANGMHWLPTRPINDDRARLLGGSTT